MIPGSLLYLNVSKAIINYGHAQTTTEINKADLALFTESFSYLVDN